MAMTKSVISTAEGVRGLTLVNNESVLIARDTQEFASHIVSLIEDPERCRVIGQKARQIALTTIDWQVLGKRLNRMVKEVMEQLNSA